MNFIFFSVFRFLFCPVRLMQFFSGWINEKNQIQINQKLVYPDHRTGQTPITYNPVDGYTTEDLMFVWKQEDPVQITTNLHLPRFTLEKYLTDYCTSKTNTGKLKNFAWPPIGQFFPENFSNHKFLLFLLLVFFKILFYFELLFSQK